jgi:transposase
MESNLETLHKRVAGIDVHRMKHVITVLIENEDGTITRNTREFGGFKRNHQGDGRLIGRAGR